MLFGVLMTPIIQQAVWRISILTLVLYPNGIYADPDSTTIESAFDYLKVAQAGLKHFDDFLAHATAVPESAEIEIGRHIARRVDDDYHLVEDLRKRRVQRIGEKLVPFVARKGIPYTFKVVESEAINAFAVAGGNVWVTTGMLDLAEDDSELAGVLGHELGHVDARHCIRAIQHQLWMSRISAEYSDYVRMGYSVYKLGYSQLNELEADTLGVQVMYKAGYDPRLMIGFLSRLENIEEGSTTSSGPSGSVQQTIARVEDFLRTHPPSKARKETLKEYIETHFMREYRE